MFTRFAIPVAPKFRIPSVTESAMKFQLSQVPLKWIGTAVVVLILGIGFVTWDNWVPPFKGFVTDTVALFKGQKQDEHGEAKKDENDHDHGHAHDESASLEVSPQAQRNIGLTDDLIKAVKPTTFWKTLTIPGTVVERHGKTHLDITAPMTGVVTGIYVVEGESVSTPTDATGNIPDERFPVMFKLRLTHEDLVKTQTAYLQSLGELNVVEKEIARLEKLTPGLVPTELRTRNYEKQKLQVIIAAQSEGLLLHGLSASQIESIRTTGKLIREILVRLPTVNPDGSLRHHSTDLRPVPSDIRPVKAVTVDAVSGRPMIIDELKVRKGQLVQAGQTLCVLSDYSELFVEGQAFEHDTADVERAAKNRWPVSVLSEHRAGDYGAKQDDELPKPPVEPDLLDGALGPVAFAAARTPIINFENRIDLTTRALHFYVRLRNRVVNENISTDGHRYIDWRFKPGQRVQLRVPIVAWKDRFVLPVDAVAQEGAEYFVFQQNGSHFDRKPVHVEYQDQYQVVIANDGSIRTGDVIAHAGAHQMQMALKIKAGGGADPHAGHHH